MNERRWRNAVIAGVALGAVFLGLALAGGFNPIDTDVKYDWLSATAAVRSDAYADVLDLAVEFDVHVGVNVPPGLTRPGPHPRTPGAILIALPLLLFDFDYLFEVATVITIASGVAILWAILGRTDPAGRVTLVILVAISAPMLMTLRYSSQAGLVAALALFAWPLLFRGKGLVGGGMLAIAGALKVFPLILLVPLLLRRRYLACGAAVAGFLILNAAGLALPGVSLAGAWRALTAASTTWVDMGNNGSLVRIVHALGVSPTVAQAVVIGMLTLFLVVAVRLRRERAVSDPIPWITAGLLLMPLSWIAYDLVIMPALASLFLANAARARWVGMTGWALWVVPMLVYPFILVDLGTFSVAARVIMLAVWWVGWLTWTDRGFNSIWVVAPSGDEPSSRVAALGSE